MLVLLVIGILHLPPAEAHGWTTKSSEPNAPIWRRSLAVEHNVSTTGAAYGQNQRSDRQTKPNGGDLPFGFGVDFGSSFSLYVTFLLLLNSPILNQADLKYLT